MTSFSSSPSRLQSAEQATPAITRTPLPLALRGPEPLSSSPGVTYTPLHKTPAATHLRPSSPSTERDAIVPVTSSPTSASPASYSLRGPKRARLSPPVTTAPAAPTKPPSQQPAQKPEPSSVPLAKKLSDAGCRMSSFKVAIPARANPPPRRKPAAAKPASAGGSEGGGSQHKVICGWRHMDDTPITSRTVSKQPRLEEVRMVSPSKRTYEQSSVAAVTPRAAASPPSTPSVLLPVPAGSPVDQEGSLVSRKQQPFSPADDAAILRLNARMKGDWVWVGKAMRPVRIAREVEARYQESVVPSHSVHRVNADPTRVARQTELHWHESVTKLLGPRPCRATPNLQRDEPRPDPHRLPANPHPPQHPPPGGTSDLCAPPTEHLCPAEPGTALVLVRLAVLWRLPTSLGGGTTSSAVVVCQHVAILQLLGIASFPDTASNPGGGLRLPPHPPTPGLVRRDGPLRVARGAGRAQLAATFAVATGVGWGYRDGQAAVPAGVLV